MKKAILASTVALLAMSSTAIATANPLTGPSIIVPILSVGDVTTGNVVINGDTTGTIYAGTLEPIMEKYTDGKSGEFYGAITVGATTQAINYHSLNKPGSDGGEPIINTPKELVFFNVGTQYTPTFTSTVERPDLDIDVKLEGELKTDGIGTSYLLGHVSIRNNDLVLER